MTVRPLDLLDLPTIYRYRHSALTLDSARSLTRGDPLGPVGMLAYLNPTRHIYTAVCRNDEKAPMLGSITHRMDETFARLSFVAPRDILDTDELPALLEHLAAQAGEWGVIHLQAEVEEQSVIFQPLRKVGFSVYAWQRIWDLSTLSITEPINTIWVKAQRGDLLAIQIFYNQIVPALLQTIEICPKQVSGLICRTDGELQGHVWVTSGPQGVLLQPMIHPDMSQVSEHIVNLISTLPARRGRPIYLCVRSYQAWLEPVLEDLGASASPRQAVMVKYLAASSRTERVTSHKREAAWANSATPMASSHGSNVEALAYDEIQANYPEGKIAPT